MGLGDGGQGAGVGCRRYFSPIHLQPFYRAEFGFKKGNFPVTEFAGRTSIAIPFHNHLTAEEIDYVAEVFDRAVPQVQ
ncbi:MAG: DegT/DnrJ/EryC1/StrS family aminotransferase [Firmicutes bacterium]|nr:DegT/DnrJ/EryC1/StrS family aminotransferase [Bacillota bacterium]